jgi:hypothetical protein
MINVSKEMLLELISSNSTNKKESTPSNNRPNHRLTGTKVIIRARDAGVWYGTLGGVDGRSVELTEARRMWRWCAAKEMTLSGVAIYGLNLSSEDLKIQSPVEYVDILDACEIISCSEAAIKTFDKVKAYNEQ